MFTVGSNEGVFAGLLSGLGNIGDTFIGYYSSAFVSLGGTSSGIDSIQDGFSFTSSQPSTDSAFIAFDLNGAQVASGTTHTIVLPIPAAVWLFGAGLVGLIAVRRKRAALLLTHAYP